MKILIADDEVMSRKMLQKTPGARGLRSDRCGEWPLCRGPLVSAGRAEARLVGLGDA